MPTSQTCISSGSNSISSGSPLPFASAPNPPNPSVLKPPGFLATAQEKYHIVSSDWFHCKPTLGVT